MDLSDNWTPALFASDPDLGERGHIAYRDMYLRLANGRLGSSPQWQQARVDRFFDLYGIPPSFSLLHKRLADQPRHACHDAIDNAAIQQLEQKLQEESMSAGKKRRNRIAWMETALERERKRRKLASIDELEPVHERFARQWQTLRQLRLADAAITAVQQHLVCDGFLEASSVSGAYDWRTSKAVGQFQRMHMLMADQRLGGYTREAFLKDQQQLDTIAMFRTLRSRVVDATGLIEDGSARGEWGTVMGHQLDGPTFRTPTGQAPLPDGAPDLISQATDAAARQLGWITPGAVRVFFAEHGAKASSHLRVAIKLPPRPAYHKEHMELHAVIDRGDVWYEYPKAGGNGCRAVRGTHMPTVTLYVSDGGREIPLLRWHTTIGGWNKELMADGRVAMKYKGSDVGHRVWRDLMVTPTWLPPDSTPDEDLVRNTPNGPVLKLQSFGPSYRSAYGLVMLIHHQVVERKSGPVFLDNGIRIHGSANYTSILRGCSHGCHRLFNHQAVRLAAFLLAHRHHIRHGNVPAYRDRRVWARGQALDLKLRSRGHRYELTPPVPVLVTEGNIRGRLKRPAWWAVPLAPPKPTPEAPGIPVPEEIAPAAPPPSPEAPTTSLESLVGELTRPQAAGTVKARVSAMTRPNES